MTSPHAPLIGRALDVTAAVGDFAREIGAPDPAKRIDQLRGRWAKGTVGIAVAGMQKRGKSRLINALLNRPDLVPVDEDVATNSHIAIAYGKTTRVTVRRPGESPAAIGLDEIRDYASTLGDPAKRRDVFGVAVTLPHDLLKGVVLYDTPGVDSLTIGHRHTTQMIVRNSDVLLFAVSGQDQPLLRHELDFLVEAAASVDRVAFVLTKIDNAPRWADLLAANRERLRAHLDGNQTAADVRQRLLDAPWLPISSRRAEVAAKRAVDGDPVRAQRLLDNSGMPALVAYLKECAAARDVIRLGPLIAAVTTVTDALNAQERDRLAAVTEDDEALRTRQVEARAAMDRMTRRVERRRLQGTRLSFLPNQIDRLVRSRLDDLYREYAAQIETADLNSQPKLAAYAATLPESLERSFDAVWQELLAGVQDVVTDSLNDLMREMEVDAIDVRLAATARPDAPATLAGGPTLRKAGFDMMTDGVRSITLSWALAGIIGNLLVPGAGIVAGPALAGVVAWRHRQRSVATNGRTDLRTYVKTAVTQVSPELTAALTEHAQLKRTEVESLVDSELAAQREDLNRRAADIRHLQQQDATARSTAAEQSRSRLARLSELATALTEVRNDLTTGTTHRTSAGESPLVGVPGSMP